MQLSDVQRRLKSPFPAHMVAWRAVAFNKERTRALLLPYLDARAVMDRLDAICPDGWSFEVEMLTTGAVKGRLTVLGVTREDIGEGDSLKAASSDALKRAAVHFGIGRYLYDIPKTWNDWDDTNNSPKHEPELPEWAKPEHERTAGGAHLLQAMEQLKYELPEDVELQREVYKHLKAALGSLIPNGRAA